MDMDIDMDLDINIDIEDPPAIPQEDPLPHLQPLPISSLNITLPEDPLNEIEGDPLPEKIHIRGLDNLSTNDLKSYVQEYGVQDQFDRIEWVDDTAANFIFRSSAAASQALQAFTDPQIYDHVTNISTLQLRPAKYLASHPNVTLFVRGGTTIDVKRKNAADASRYYLMNPDQDPREKRRQRRYDDSGDERDGDYHRRRFDENENKRRRNDHSAFDVDMYDDNPSRAESKRPRGGEDLFANRQSSSLRSRNRSTSPSYLGNNRYSRRSASPPRHSREEENRGKELFPAVLNTGKELFPPFQSHSSSASTAPRAHMDSVLVPNPKRSSGSHHRRSDAVSSLSPQHPGLSLADRITGRPRIGSDDIRILGAAKDEGFSIKGAAGQSVKELFPLKSGGSNSGKELFAEKIQGRGGARRKAEDMFG